MYSMPLTVPLQMVKIVNFMLYKLYHDFLDLFKILKNV